MNESGGPLVPYMPAVGASVKVHNTLAINESVLWYGHIVFTALAILAVGFIVLARGPRRREANLSAQIEAEQVQAPVAQVVPGAGQD